MLGNFEMKKEVVLSLFKSTKVDKSPGHDGIYVRLLRGKRGDCWGPDKELYLR